MVYRFGGLRPLCGELSSDNGHFRLTRPDGTPIKWRMRGAPTYTKPTQGCFGAKWGSICMYRSVMFHTWGGEGDGGGIHGHFARGHFFTDKMSVKGSHPTISRLREYPVLSPAT